MSREPPRSTRRDPLVPDTALFRSQLLREAKGAARRGEQPDLDLRQRELRGVGGDDQVAHQRELAAAAEGEAVDRADDRPRDRMRGETAETPRLLLGLLGGEAFPARQLTEVRAGADTLVAPPGDAHHADSG